MPLGGAWAILSVLNGCVRFMEWCICSLGSIWALRLWFEFGLVPILVSGSLLKVVFDRRVISSLGPGISDIGRYKMRCLHLLLPLIFSSASLHFAVTF